MKHLISLILVLSTLFAGGCATGWNPNEDNETQAEVQAAIAAFKKADPKLERFFAKAYGYVVYPTVGKGGLGIGGAYGSGTVFQQGKVIGTSHLTQITIGFQMGGQAYREIIF